jgi:uncharacterized protein YxeA
MAKRQESKGFGVVAVMIVAVVLVAVGTAGWAVYYHNHKVNLAASKKSSSAEKSASASTTSNPTTSSSSLKSYNVSGGQTSLRVSYPSNLKVEDGGNAFSSSIVDPSNMTASINIRTIELANTITPSDEWNKCPSVDACGPTLGDIKLSESPSTTINGLESYTVKMQGPSGVYHAAVIKSRSNSNGLSLFTEFLVYSDDTNSIAQLDKVVATASSTFK